MSRICEDTFSGLRFDFSRVMRIDSIVKSGTDKPYYTVHYNDGTKEQVTALSASDLTQSYYHVSQCWKHYEKWGY
ncbi:hypothetical protein SDC9_69837 [bioreactor metagenome]|uniref:Uncharacterized protein n=1 Tax=bioreactor metagenome TaxID=1076179 RepID=A0A644Y454_9ZZZZ